MVGIRTANAMRTTIAHNYVTNTGSYGITVGSGQMWRRAAMAVTW